MRRGQPPTPSCAASVFAMTLAPVLLGLAATAPKGMKVIVSDFIEGLSKAGVDSAAQLKAMLDAGPAELVAAVFPDRAYEDSLSGGWGFPEVCRLVGVGHLSQGF